MHTLHLFDPDLSSRDWIRSALAEETLNLFGWPLESSLADLPRLDDGDGVLVAIDGLDRQIIEQVHDLRRRGIQAPVMVLGPHAALPVAVMLARLHGTTFLARPLSAVQLRAVVRHCMAPIGGRT